MIREFLAQGLQEEAVAELSQLFVMEKKENNLHVVETQYGNFSRSFSLPENVDASKIQAAYNNGILEIFIPKDEKKTLKTTIKVN